MTTIDEDTTATSGAPLRRLFLLTASLTLGYGSVFTLLGDLREELGFSETEVGLIASLGFVGGFVSQVALARLADRGRAALLVRGGVAAAATSMAVMSVADEAWQFVAARFVFGLGTGALTPALRRVVIDRDPERVGENLGRMTAFDIGGFVLGPVVAAVFEAIGGLRAPFVALLILYVALLPVVGATDLRIRPAEPGTRVLRRLLATPAFVASLAVAVAFYTTVGVFEAVWAIMLKDLGAGTLFVGITLSLFTVPMVVLAPYGGRAAQRRGPLVVARGGVLVASACMVGYGITAQVAEPGAGPAVVALAILTVLSMVHAMADSFTMPANQVAIAMSSPPGQVAAGQGLFGATGLLVAAIVSAATGGLYDVGGPLVLMLSAAAVMLVMLGIGLRLGREVLAAPVSDAPPPTTGATRDADRPG